MQKCIPLFRNKRRKSKKAGFSLLIRKSLFFDLWSEMTEKDEVF